MGRVSEAKEHLIETGKALMHVRGYTAVSVQDICQHAGVNKGSFYYFFPAKRDLMLAVIDAYEEQYQQQRDTILATKVSPLKKLQRLVTLHYPTPCTVGEDGGPVQGCPFGNLALELSSQDEVVRQRLQAVFDGWAEAFANVLQEAVDTGELSSIDVETTAQSLLAYFEGVILLAKAHNNAGLFQNLAEGMMRLIGAPVAATGRSKKH